MPKFFSVCVCSKQTALWVKNKLRFDSLHKGTREKEKEKRKIDSFSPDQLAQRHCVCLSHSNILIFLDSGASQIMLSWPWLRNGYYAVQTLAEVKNNPIILL